MFSVKKIFSSFSTKPIGPVRYRHYHDPTARPVAPIINRPSPTRMNTQVSFSDDEPSTTNTYPRTPYNTPVFHYYERNNPLQPPYNTPVSESELQLNEVSTTPSGGSLPPFAESPNRVPIAPARRNSDDSIYGHDAYNPPSPSPQEMSGLRTTWGRRTLQQVLKAPTPRKPLGRQMRAQA